MTSDALTSQLDAWRAGEPRLAAAWLFLGAAERVRFGALAALEHEWLSTVRGAREPQVAVAKLGWWREELQRAARGEARHPLARALFADARIRQVTPACWDAAVAAAALAIGAPPPSDFAAQQRAVQALAQAFADLETGVWFGVRATGPRASELVSFAILVDDLRAMGGGARAALPMSVLARYALASDALAADSPARRAAVRDQAAELERGLAGALTMNSSSTLFRVVRAQHDLAALRRARRAGDPLSALLAPAHGIRGLLKTWRAARMWRRVARNGNPA